jgi:hypothetical protein
MATATLGLGNKGASFHRKSILSKSAPQSRSRQVIDLIWFSPGHYTSSQHPQPEGAGFSGTYRGGSLAKSRQYALFSGLWKT